MESQAGGEMSSVTHPHKYSNIPPPPGMPATGLFPITARRSWWRAARATLRQLLSAEFKGVVLISSLAFLCWADSIAGLLARATASCFALHRVTLPRGERGRGDFFWGGRGSLGTTFRPPSGTWIPDLSNTRGWAAFTHRKTTSLKRSQVFQHSETPGRTRSTKDRHRFALSQFCSIPSHDSWKMGQIVLPKRSGPPCKEV